MRAIWTGAISFGLVNIPVKLYSASGDNKLDLDMLSKEDLAPIRYAKISTSTGQEIEFKDIVKGYEIEKGQYVILDDEDFKKANARKTRTIEILDFVLEEEIDPVYYEKPYYLEPDKNSERPYALLREALRDSKKVGIANYVLRNKEHIAVIKPMGDVIVLNQLRFHADIRDYNQLNLPGKDILKKNEKEMALKLIDQLTQEFNPSRFQDTYTEELKSIIEAKAKGKPFESKTTAPEPTHVKDLMDTLKASLEAMKDKKPESRPAVKSGKQKAESGKARSTSGRKKKATE
ncbi:MAG: Ku protein [Cytophagaceae bacterium]